MHRIRIYITLFVATAIAWLLLPAVALAQAPLENTDVGNVATDPITVQYWAIVTGFFLPPLISVIQKSTWSQRLQAMVMFVVALIATLLQPWLYGQLDNFTDPAAAIILVLVTTIASYKGLWKPSGISPAIEAKVGLT
jgi:surface polysaccharide O-acyltransferase-like enzyme